jgi:hypothetical protein
LRSTIEEDFQKLPRLLAEREKMRSIEQEKNNRANQGSLF